VSEPGPRIALTFDAEHPDRPRCPPDAADRILDALARAGARATFFLQGRWAQAHPERARRIADEGHLVGNHSQYHARMRLLRDEGIRSDVIDAAGHIRAACGLDPRPWFRCPFGDGHDDARVLASLEGLGYRNVHWDLELEDWEPWTTGEGLAEATVAGALALGDGAVVLLHTWPASTADAIPAILDRLAGADARFVSVDALERLP
jgi:peptidoglycan/xylan/chitin deacetylase (PgdA/CDA1 family)